MQVEIFWPSSVLQQAMAESTRRANLRFTVIVPFQDVKSNVNTASALSQEQTYWKKGDEGVLR
jgi:hypothetical protein